MKCRGTGSQNLMGSFLTQNTTQLIIPVKKFNGAKANKIALFTYQGSPIGALLI
jgi:putative heme iron utilization protein